MRYELKKITAVIFFFGLCSLFFLNLHNVLSFPVTRGLDATAHIEYIQYLQINKHLPAPDEGWELYQPPVYYLLASLLPSLKAAQFLGLFSWLIILGCVHWFFKRKSLALILLVASLPVLIYQIPALTNELFAAAMTTLTMVYYLKIFVPKLKKQSNSQSLSFLVPHLILGVLLAISLLSKYTAILLIPTILLERFFTNFKSLQSTKLAIKSTFKQLLPFLLLTFILSGWFYLKNLIKYHNPLITSVDFPAWSSFGQPVVTRNLYFFTNLKGFFNLDFFHSQDYSFLSGTYFSFFYDAHNVVIPPQELPSLGVILFLLSIPLALISLKGIWQTLKSKQNSSSLFFLVFSFFLLVSYILYNFKHPYYSTIKASFLTSAVLPFAFFFHTGVEKWNKKMKLGLLIYLGLYALMVVKHFWVQGWWY